MSISIPGIKSILKCTKGTLATTPTLPLYAGIRDKATMNFKPYKATDEHKGRPTRNMLQASLEYETRQATIRALSVNFSLMNCNADYQILSEKQALASGSEDVFKFNASSFLLGHGFEYHANMERRWIKETLKGAADYDVVKALIDAGDSETAVSVTGITHPGGEDWSLVRGTKILALQSPASTDLVDIANGELQNLEFAMKAITSENATGQLCVDMIDCSLEVECKNASVAKIVTQLEKSLGGAVLLKFGNGTSTFDCFDFEAGVLAPVDEPEISDDKRTLKMTYKGKVRPYEFAFQVGTALVGDEVDGTGTAGGTVKIGY